MLGALFFTLTVNVVTLLGLNTAVGIIISGALTLFAVFLYSGWQPADRCGIIDRMLGRLPRAAAWMPARMKAPA